MNTKMSAEEETHWCVCMRMLCELGSATRERMFVLQGE